MPPIVWGVILWIIVPAVLFLAGYKVVGPRIGEVPVLEKQAEKMGELIANKAPASGVPIRNDKQSDETTSDKTGPDIEVTVEKSNAKPDRPKRRKKKKPAAESTRSTTRTRDDASTDGAVRGGDGPADPASGGEG